MQPLAAKYAANDLEAHWLPFTANRQFKGSPRLFVKAAGMYLWNHHGRKVLDGVSSLFCCAAGHGRKEIAEAVGRQLAEMDYAPPFQFAHPASFELARRVAALTPGDLNHIFFTNSGSESVDTALKIALAYHRARGEGQRQRFVGRERGYHGMNFGGLSVGGLPKNREAFGIGLPGIIHIRHTWRAETRFTRGEAETGAELADDLERAIGTIGAETVAACIVEPIAGSTGCLVPPKGYLKRLRDICTKYGILLIFDEVITGFGRTGKPFGAHSFDVTPDMITMAKALTNGVVPMGAVAVDDRIYETICNKAPENAIELFHGYTYSATPSACAAGLAAQDIYVKESLFDRAAAMAPYFLDMLFGLRGIPVITDIRGYGMLGALDLAPLKTPGERGFRAMTDLFEAGLLAKITGDAVLLAPPFIAEKSQIDEIGATLRKVLGKY